MEQLPASWEMTHLPDRWVCSPDLHTFRDWELLPGQPDGSAKFLFKSASPRLGVTSNSLHHVAPGKAVTWLNAAGLPGYPPVVSTLTSAPSPAWPVLGVPSLSDLSPPLPLRLPTCQHLPSF